jgi:hypothetical protein
VTVKSVVEVVSLPCESVSEFVLCGAAGGVKLLVSELPLEMRLAYITIKWDRGTNREDLLYHRSVSELEPHYKGSLDRTSTCREISFVK